MGKGNRFIEVYSSPIDSTVNTDHGTKNNGVRLLETAVPIPPETVLQGPDSDLQDDQGKSDEESDRFI